MQSYKSLLIRISFVGLSFIGTVYSQDKTDPTPPTGVPVLWEACDISKRDLYQGPGGLSNAPVLRGSRFMGSNPGGNNLKYTIMDGAKRKWVVKIADESQPELAATRLLWAIGYKTEIDYMVPRLDIPGVGNYKNARFELRPDDVKRGTRWSWADNPFNKARELNGLRIMMALINNWDLKDENTAVLAKDGRLDYVVSDLGSSFGKLADKNMSRSGRSVNNAADYAKAKFIKGVNNGVIDFDYRGMNEDVVKGITVDDARWLSALLRQLSEKQIEDAFRAANYQPEAIEIYAGAVRARIAALDRATQEQTAQK